MVFRSNLRNSHEVGDYHPLLRTTIPGSIGAGRSGGGAASGPAVAQAGLASDDEMSASAPCVYGHETGGSGANSVRRNFEILGSKDVH